MEKVFSYIVKLHTIPLDLEPTKEKTPAKKTTQKKALKAEETKEELDKE